MKFEVKIIKIRFGEVKMGCRLNVLRASIITSMLLSYPAYSEEENKPKKSSGPLEEIIVTAQKRSESLQDVPIAVNAFNEQDVIDKGIDNPIDLNVQVPGFQFGSLGGFTTAFLRGVGSDAFLMADPSVALYIDGVYFPFSHGLAQSFGGVERIEILKGPQGTLFGRNATGGAMNVVTKSPGEEFEVSLLASRSSWETERLRAYINIPVADSFSLSVSGIKNSVGQFYENGVAAGKSLPKDISEGGRIKARFKFGGSAELNLSAFKLNQKGVTTMFMPNTAPSPIMETLGAKPAPHYEGEVDGGAYFDSSNTVYYGSLYVETHWFDAKVLASDQFMTNAALLDLDGTEINVATLETKELFADVQSAELQIMSNESTWLSDRVEWIFGAYYFKSLQGFNPLALTPLSFEGSGLSNLLSGIPDPVVDLVQQVLDMGSQPQLQLTGVVDTDSVAFYLQTDISIFSWFDITLGGRYQDEKRAISESKTELLGTNGIIPTVTIFDWEKKDDTTKSFSPKISFNFYPYEGGLVYTNWQKATKSSAFNVTKLTQEPDKVRPEVMEAFEVGLKTDLFDNTVRFNLAAFHYSIVDLQTQFVSLFEGGVTAFENADDTQISGFDYDLTVAILPSLIEGLFFKSSGAFIDAEYKKYTDASGFDEKSGLFFSDGDFSGNRVVRTPEKSGNASLSKEFDTDFGLFNIAVDYYYNSGFYYLSQNSEDSWQDAYEVFGFQASYEYVPWGLKLSAYGKNVKDEYYSIAYLHLDFGRLEYAAPPSEYGFRVSLDI